MEQEIKWDKQTKWSKQIKGLIKLLQSLSVQIFTQEDNDGDNIHINTLLS